MSRSITKKQISLRVPIETLDAAQAEADERGIPQSEILRALWELRCRLKALPHGQRLAIVRPIGTISDKPLDFDGYAQIVEFIDVLAGAPAPKPKRKRRVAA